MFKEISLNWAKRGKIDIMAYHSSSPVDFHLAFRPHVRFYAPLERLASDFLDILYLKD